jgi:integrase
MVLQMTRPQKNRKTGIYYFRQKTPADLVDVFGKKEVGWSLGTRDPDRAKVLHGLAQQKQASVWATLRKRPEPLPHIRIVALSGVLYRSYMSMLEKEPGEASLWAAVLKLTEKASSTPASLEQWYGEEADRLLLEQGIVTDEVSRNRLLQEVHRSTKQWAEQQLKRAEGDYSPDPKADRFPRFAPTSSAPDILTDGDKVTPTISSLFHLWERDHLASGKPARTVVDFRQKIDSLIAYLGHDDALMVTPEKIVDWCDYLRHEKGLKARTVGQKYLAVAKLVFAIAVEKRKLKENPTVGTKVRYEKSTRTRSKGYTDEEAKAILAAALADPDSLGRRETENKRAIRWGPWICAFTGARIAEVMQLRTEDLLEEEVHGETVYCLRITPDAGSVKAGNYRVVPVHPQLLELGLVETFRSLSVASELFPQCNDILGQPRFVWQAARNLALCRTMLPECAAGPALRYAKGLPHVIKALTAAGRAQKFPRAASVRIILSSVRSDTARRSRWFSVSSSFRRFN